MVEPRYRRLTFVVPVYYITDMCPTVELRNKPEYEGMKRSNTACTGTCVPETCYTPCLTWQNATLTFTPETSTLWPQTCIEGYIRLEYYTIYYPTESRSTPSTATIALFLVFKACGSTLVVDVSGGVFKFFDYFKAGLPDKQSRKDDQQ